MNIRSKGNPLLPGLEDPLVLFRTILTPSKNPPSPPSFPSNTSPPSSVPPSPLLSIPNIPVILIVAIHVTPAISTMVNRWRTNRYKALDLTVWPQLGVIPNKAQKLIPKFEGSHAVTGEHHIKVFF